jgi:hypothetical protein
VLLKAAHIKQTLAAMQIAATTYRAFARERFALRYAATEPARPSSQIIKPDANGKATRWQGYVAREGFGITRIKNHIRANSPEIGNSHLNQFSQRNLLFCSNEVCFLRENSIFTTSGIFNRLLRPNSPFSTMQQKQRELYINQPHPQVITYI